MVPAIALGSKSKQTRKISITLQIVTFLRTSSAILAVIENMFKQIAAKQKDKPALGFLMSKIIHKSKSVHSVDFQGNLLVVNGHFCPK